MCRRTFVAAASALALLAGASAAKADDIIRLGGPGTEAKTMTLGFDGQADTELTRYARGGFYGGGGYRGGFVGYRGGFYGGYRGGFYGGGYRGGFVGYRGGFYGGYRGAFYGGYRGFCRPYYAGFYRPFYAGYGGYYPRYGYGFNYGYYNYPIYSSYSSPVYYTPSYYVNPPYYYDQPYPSYSAPVMPYAPISTSGPLAVNGNGGRYVDYYAAQAVPNVNGSVPVATPANNGGTFQYDGGPSSPIPLPAGTPAPAPLPSPEPAPMKAPAAKAAPGTLLITYPPQPATPARQATTQFAYPAYGEDTRATSFGTARTAPATKRTTTQTSR